MGLTCDLQLFANLQSEYWQLPISKYCNYCFCILIKCSQHCTKIISAAFPAVCPDQLSFREGLSVNDNVSTFFWLLIKKKVNNL